MAAITDDRTSGCRITEFERSPIWMERDGLARKHGRAGWPQFPARKDFSTVWSALAGYALIETDVILSHPARSEPSLEARAYSAAVYHRHAVYGAQ